MKLGMIVAITALIVFLCFVLKSMENNYQELHKECIEENVLSNFECKQAAYHMAYGE